MQAEAERDVDGCELTAEVAAEIDTIGRSFVEGGKAPGLAYGLVREGAVVHAGGTGTAGDGRPAPGVDSVFRIASMTKSFTAAAVLLLRDEGALHLDVPIATYLPAVAGIAQASDDAPPLTLRLLLTMSGGFPADDPWADRQESMSDDEFEALLRRGPRHSAVPGTGFEYSNLGYAIAGRVVGAVAGQPYQRFVTERLLIPLGMRSTCFSSEEVRGEHLVTGHRRVDDRWQPEPFDRPGAFSAIGGLYSSVADLAIWVSGFLNASSDSMVGDGHPISRATRREMQQAYRFSDVGTSTVDGVAHAFAKGYGLGLTLDRHTHWGDVVGHSGGYPGFGSNMRWHAASRYGVIVLANSTYANPASAAAAMLEHVLRHGAPRMARSRAWPEVSAMRAVVERLLSGWDDQLADEVFAMNMDLDVPRAERRQRIAGVIDQLGPLDLAAPADEQRPSAAALDWTVTGSLRQARIEMGLSPEPSPKIQSLEVRLIESTPPADAQADLDPASAVGP